MILHIDTYLSTYLSLSIYIYITIYQSVTQRDIGWIWLVHNFFNIDPFLMIFVPFESSHSQLSNGAKIIKNGSILKNLWGNQISCTIGHELYYIYWETSNPRVSTIMASRIIDDQNMILDVRVFLCFIGFSGFFCVMCFFLDFSKFGTI